MMDLVDGGAAMVQRSKPIFSGCFKISKKGGYIRCPGAQYRSMDEDTWWRIRGKASGKWKSEGGAISPPKLNSRPYCL